MNRKETIILMISSGLTTVCGFFVFKRASCLSSLTMNLPDCKELIGDIAEAIIPETTTPGAKKADVAEYIINVVENCVPWRDKKVFLYGLRKLERHCLEFYGRSFSHCDRSTQYKILEILENKALTSSSLLYRFRKNIFGQPFFLQIKYLTVEGYFNSKLGLTRGRNISYGESSCIP